MRPSNLKARCLPEPVGAGVVIFVAITLASAGLSGCWRGYAVPTTQAVEVPVDSSADLERLKAILRRYASEQHLSLWDKSTFTRRYLSQGEQSVDMYLFRKDDPVVMVEDNGHASTPWVYVTDEAAASNPEIRAAEASLAEQLRQSWAGARRIPILPDGGLPFWRDLRLTPSGYRVAASVAAEYSLGPTSTMVDRNPADQGARKPVRPAYCDSPADLANLDRASLQQLNSLRDYYRFCRYDPAATDRITAELVQRNDPVALRDAAVLADARGDMTNVVPYLRRSAAAGDLDAIDSLDSLKSGRDP